MMKKVQAKVLHSYSMDDEKRYRLKPHSMDDEKRYRLKPYSMEDEKKVQAKASQHGGWKKGTG